MVVLHGEPALWRAAYGLGKPQRHVWRNAAGAVEDMAERGGRDVQLGRELATADAMGLQIGAGDELARMRGLYMAISRRKPLLRGYGAVLETSGKAAGLRMDSTEISTSNRGQ